MVLAAFAHSKCPYSSLVSVKSAMDFLNHPLPHGLSCLILTGCAPVLRRPFFALLPCWWSFHRLHRLKRAHTLFQGSYRSGKSCQGISVFSQYRIPLSIVRLSFPDLPPDWLLWRQLLFHVIPLSFCQFVSLHTFTLLLRFCNRRGKYTMAIENKKFPKSYLIFWDSALYCY